MMKKLIIITLLIILAIALIVLFIYETKMYHPVERMCIDYVYEQPDNLGGEPWHVNAYLFCIGGKNL